MKKYIFFALISTFLFACSSSTNEEKGAADSTLLENGNTHFVSTNSKKELNIEEYFKIIPEKYLPIPLNRRNAVLNAKNPEYCVTIKDEKNEKRCWYCNVSDNQNAFINIVATGPDWSSMYEMAYWTLPNGDKHLALSYNNYIFETNKNKYFIAFLKYYPLKDKWEELPNPIPKLTVKDIVPQNMIQKWSLSPSHTPNFNYELPQKGKTILLHWYVTTEFPQKNIPYEEQKQIPNTVELIWEDGTFSVGKKYYQ